MRLRELVGSIGTTTIVIGVVMRASSPVTTPEAGPLTETRLEIAQEAGIRSAELADNVLVAVSMPQLSWSTDRTVEGWFKQVGDYVQAGDLLIVVSEGRFNTTELRAPISGFLREVIIPAHVTVATGTELGMVEAVLKPRQEERYQQANWHNQPSVVAQQGPRVAGQISSPTWYYTGETSSVTMPSVEGSEPEGTVIQWLKQVGEYIDLNEPVVKITTDMVDIVIPAPGSGLLDKVVVEEDERVPTGTVLGVIKGVIKETPMPIANVVATRPLFTLKAPTWVADTARPTILRWLKPAGSRVELHESLVEITTDYFDVAVKCPVAGVLHTILATEDETVAVGTKLALIDIAVQPGAAKHAGNSQLLLSLALRSLLSVCDVDAGYGMVARRPVELLQHHTTEVGAGRPGSG